jgi:hypothetical protein
MADFPRGLGGGPLALLILGAAAAAQPLDLLDPTPRWVAVEFESSPAEEPGRLAAAWSPRLPAWFQPAERPGWVLVAVPGPVVERQLVAAEDPQPGSFGPFVWVFEAATGRVLAAELEGVLRRRLDWGLLRARVPAEIRIELDTERRAGFLAPRRILGQRLHDACDPAAEPRCTAVAPVPYDPATGYVNAVGEIAARWNGLGTRAFCTLGEARFSELGAPAVRLSDAGVR